jgi:hypothetical protein
MGTGRRPTVLAPSQKRREQLRLAKREHRRRQRGAGLTLCQVAVSPHLGELLREAVRHPDIAPRLEDWLAVEVIDVRAWPQLHLLCWNRHERWITGVEALSLYERNWRFIAPAELSPEEARFVEQLTRRHGRGILHV